MHSALYIESGRTLVVTFDNLDHVLDNSADRLPWGFNFIQSRGWSMLGMMAHGWTWYRDDAVFDFFDELRDTGFFDKFDNVIFYGASMGGYAAGAFSSAVPNAKVIMISPQATLARDIVPWETRYKRAGALTFDGRYSFAPESVSNIKSAYLVYDPTMDLDRMHADLFLSNNVQKLNCRFMGHRIASAMHEMGILKDFVERVVEDRFDNQVFYKTLRRRKSYTRYLKSLLSNLQEKDKHYFSATVCSYYLLKWKGPHFRHALDKSLAEIYKSGGKIPSSVLKLPLKMA